MTIAKLVLTGAALGATGYARILGRKVSARTDVPVASGTTPADTTPPDVADALKQLRLLQWAIPAATGAVLVLNAFAGEQQRSSEAVQGVLARLTGQ